MFGSWRDSEASECAPHFQSFRYTRPVRHACGASKLTEANFAGRSHLDFAGQSICRLGVPSRPAIRFGGGRGKNSPAIEQPKQECRTDKQVKRCDPIGGIAEERLPPLGWWSPVPYRALGDRGLTDPIPSLRSSPGSAHPMTAHQISLSVSPIGASIARFAKIRQAGSRFTIGTALSRDVGLAASPEFARNS
jgi:hypothetical protein